MTNNESILYSNIDRLRTLAVVTEHHLPIPAVGAQLMDTERVVDTTIDLERLSSSRPLSLCRVRRVLVGVADLPHRVSPTVRVE